MVILNIMTSCILACHAWIITVPTPSFIALTSSEANSVEIIGSDVTLTCSVRLNPAILGSEILLLAVETQLFRDGIRVALDGPTVVGTTYTYVAQLNSFGRSDYGNYNCTTVIRPHPSLTHSYVIGTDILSDTLNIYISKLVLSSWQCLHNN